jgi:chitodextrinase
MFAKSTALTVGVLTLALVFVAAPSAGKKPPPTQSDKQAPTTPTNLRITSSTDTSISLAWDASTDNSTNWWYCVQRDGGGCFRVEQPGTTFTMSRLAPDRTTTWTVYAIDAAGNRSGNSNSVTFTTPPDTTAPSPAPAVSAAIVVPTWVHITWTKSFDNITDVSYRVLLDGNVVWDSVAYTFFTAFHLLPSSTHEFKVIARDGFGNAAESSVLTVTTPPKRDDVAPTAPTNLTLGFQSSQGEAWLSWGQATDDTDPESLIRYEVFFNDFHHDDDGAIGSGGTIAYCRVVTGTAVIVVRAIDTSGNVSEPSNAIPFDC